MTRLMKCSAEFITLEKRPMINLRKKSLMAADKERVGARIYLEDSKTELAKQTLISIHTFLPAKGPVP